MREAKVRRCFTFFQFLGAIRLTWPSDHFLYSDGTVLVVRSSVAPCSMQDREVANEPEPVSPQSNTEAEPFAPCPFKIPTGVYCWLKMTKLVEFMRQRAMWRSPVLRSGRLGKK